jgi:uncharacterized protein YgbK (DUF1537 family)
VVTVFESDELAAGFSEAGSTCFFLTSTRSLAEADAVELNTRIGQMLLALTDRLDAPIDVVSRSDSTLRGHVIAEVRAPSAARREATSRGFDGVLLAPAYFEAGRFTAGGRALGPGGHRRPTGQRDRVRRRRHLRLCGL